MNEGEPKGLGKILSGIGKFGKNKDPNENSPANRLVKGDFGWQHEFLEKGISENKVIEIKQEVSNKNLTSIRTHPEVIEDVISGTKINDQLVNEELEAWQSLIKKEGYWALLVEAIKSTPAKWKEHPERYMALAIELRTFNTTTSSK
ncbi:hypothetical protein HZA26_04390 [Candidatus Nomurabacteria bacterium]|nr:hypothetical protein [Candidatus Nomurabacteria bacterium]